MLVPAQFMITNAPEQVGCRKHTSRLPTMMLQIFLVLQFPYPGTPWPLGHIGRIVIKRRSLTVLLPAVTTEMLVPAQFMFTNAPEQVGCRKHTSRQSTIMLQIFLVIKFPYPGTPWPLGRKVRLATRRRSLMALLPVVTTVMLVPAQLMFTNAPEQVGRRKHTSRLPTMMLMNVLVGRFP